jgi:hypothetical protein
MEQTKLIKSITTKRYTIELTEKNDGMYYIYYDGKNMKHARLSEAIKDFNTATYLFDLKLREFEGN